MSWYQEADNSKDLNYTAPKISKQTLDAAGNYVSPATATAKGQTGDPTKLGTSVIE